MSSARTTHNLGTILLLGSIAVPRPSGTSSYYRARTSGSPAAALEGSAEWKGKRPTLGTYPISAEPTPDGIQLVIVTGGPDHPAGVLRPGRGAVTITSSSWNRITGRFEMVAEGRGADATEQENQTVLVQGSFNTTPPR